MSPSLHNPQSHASRVAAACPETSHPHGTPHRPLPFLTQSLQPHIPDLLKPQVSCQLPSFLSKGTTQPQAQTQDAAQPPILCVSGPGDLTWVYTARSWIREWPRALSPDCDPQPSVSFCILARTPLLTAKTFSAWGRNPLLTFPPQGTLKPPDRATPAAPARG